MLDAVSESQDRLECWWSFDVLELDCLIRSCREADTLLWREVVDLVASNGCAFDAKKCRPYRI
jgi:hypothetical protein